MMLGRRTPDLTEPDDSTSLRLQVMAARVTQLRARERRDMESEQLATIRMNGALERWARLTRSMTVRPGAGATT